MRNVLALRYLVEQVRQLRMAMKVGQPAGLVLVDPQHLFDLAARIEASWGLSLIFMCLWRSAAAYIAVSLHFIYFLFIWLFIAGLPYTSQFINWWLGLACASLQGCDQFRTFLRGYFSGNAIECEDSNVRVCVDKFEKHRGSYRRVLNWQTHRCVPPNG